MSYSEYQHQILAVQEQLRSLSNDISMTSKADGHEFRKKYQSKNRLNLSSFSKILGISTEDEDNAWIDIGGMIKYDDLVKSMISTHHSRFIPAIVPELLSITVGGAISGIGIESTSFKYGLVHDTVIDMDILTSDGNVVFCSRKETRKHQEDGYEEEDGKNSDLFYGIPNSYGTLGYILRAKIRIIPSQPVIQLIHYSFTSSKEAFQVFEKESNNIMENDFIEGIVFNKNNFHILIGKFYNPLEILLNHRNEEEIEEKGKELAKKHENIEIKDFNLTKSFYRSILESDIKEIEYTTLYHYLSRWDVDGFWGTSSISLLQNSWIRYYFRNYLKTELLLKFSRLPILQTIISLLASSTSTTSSSLSGSPSFGRETITTDNGIPIEHWQTYYDWYFTTFPDSNPLWLCSFRTFSTCPLLKVKTNHLFCDFGTFSYEIPSINSNPRYFNEIIEKKIFELNGMKCFYSVNCFPDDSYEKVVNHSEYLQLKEKYDSQKKFPMLKDKVFL
jgi:hypothetical protein